MRQPHDARGAARTGRGSLARAHPRNEHGIALLLVRPTWTPRRVRRWETATTEVIRRCLAQTDPHEMELCLDRLQRRRATAPALVSPVEGQPLDLSQGLNRFLNLYEHREVEFTENLFHGAGFPYDPYYTLPGGACVTCEPIVGYMMVTRLKNIPDDHYSALVLIVPFRDFWWERMSARGPPCARANPQ